MITISELENIYSSAVIDFDIGMVIDGYQSISAQLITCDQLSRVHTYRFFYLFGEPRILLGWDYQYLRNIIIHVHVF